jgi:hypothetical protein
MFAQILGLVYEIAHKLVAGDSFFLSGVWRVPRLAAVWHVMAANKIKNQRCFQVGPYHDERCAGHAAVAIPCVFSLIHISNPPVAHVRMQSKHFKGMDRKQGSSRPARPNADPTLQVQLALARVGLALAIGPEMAGTHGCTNKIYGLARPTSSCSLSSPSPTPSLRCYS